MLDADPIEYLATLCKAYRKQYTEYSDEWSRDLQMRVLPSLVQGQLKLASSASALDIGCGSGQDVAYFAGIYSQVVGIDIYQHENWEDIEQAQLNVEFHCCDLLGFATPRKFDVVMDNGCFHHQHPAQYQEYLQKIKSLMAANGAFVLSTFKNPAKTAVIDANGRLHHYFSDAQLHEILHAQGFVLTQEFDIYRPAKKDYYRLSFCKI